MKDIEPDAGKDPDSRHLKGLHTESDDMVETVQGKMETLLKHREEAYRIWHCNGLPIKLRIHKEPP